MLGNNPKQGAKARRDVFRGLECEEVSRKKHGRGPRNHSRTGMHGRPPPRHICSDARPSEFVPIGRHRTLSLMRRRPENLIRARCLMTALDAAPTSTVHRATNATHSLLLLLTNSLAALYNHCPATNYFTHIQFKCTGLLSAFPSCCSLKSKPRIH